MSKNHERRQKNVRLAGRNPSIKLLSIKMNYDEYIKEVSKFSDDEVVARLRKYLAEWKQDDTNVIKLADSIEHFFGNSWIGSEKIHNHLYRLWLHFKTEAITGIGGMTINERLYRFGLLSALIVCKQRPPKR